MCGLFDVTMKAMTLFVSSSASRWEGLIAKEFSEQAEQERAAGLTPAPFMQFELDDIKHRSKLQCDFIDFVLIPLWGPYTHLIPDMRYWFVTLS